VRKKERATDLTIPSIRRVTSASPHLIVTPVRILDTMDPGLSMGLDNRRVGSVVVVEIVGLGVVTRLGFLVVIVIKLLSTSKVRAIECHGNWCGVVSRGSGMGKDGR